MKIQVALATFFFTSFVSANSGIPPRDGQLLPSPIERSSHIGYIAGGLNKKETVQRNADRLRRGLSPLPPSRRAPGYKRMATFLFGYRFLSSHNFSIHSEASTFFATLCATF
jgi:hypothetical protein